MVHSVHCTGDCFVLQGGFRNNEFPSLILDKSANPHIFWNDGTLQFPDPGAFPTQHYGYADILTTMSSNGGLTWSAPVRVSSPQPTSGRGTDKYQPGAAVDKLGVLATCYYSRQNDPTNFNVDRFCSVSSNNGATWASTKVTTGSFPPIHATDVILNPVYMGDYDGLTSDATGANSGFLGAFAINTSKGDPNAQVVKF